MGPDDVVGQQAEEAPITHRFGSLQDRMAEAERFLLHHHPDLDLLQAGQPSFHQEVLLDQMAGVEVDDDENLLRPGPGGLFDHVLDGGTVDDGQQSLWVPPGWRGACGSLCRRPEPQQLKRSRDHLLLGSPEYPGYVPTVAKRHKSQYGDQDPEGRPPDSLPVGERQREKDHDQRGHRGDLPHFGDQGPGRSSGSRPPAGCRRQDPAAGRHPFAALEAVIDRDSSVRRPPPVRSQRPTG